MSTRAFIIAYTGSTGPKAGNYRGIYVHNDGQPFRVGLTLQESYRSFERAQELMDLGHLSVLAPEIGEKHGFNEVRYDGSERAEQIRRWCLAYGRDRGEAGQEAGLYGSIIEAVIAGKNSDADHIYIWQEELGRWQIIEGGVGRGARMVDYSTERGA